MTDTDKDFIPEICDLKHEALDKNVEEISEDIEKIKKNENQKHEEIKNMITELTMEVRDSHVNLKNKIVLAEKTMGDKIDSLYEFDESLKGNGNPGIWENIRTINKNIKWLFAFLIIIFILTLGGNIKGVSINGIKESIIGSNIKIQQVELIPLIVHPAKETPLIKPLKK